MKLLAIRTLTVVSLVVIFAVAPARSQSGGQSSGSAALYLDRANASYAKGNLDAALADYDIAIAFDPAWALLYARRAQARTDQENLEGAVSDYNKAIELAPGVAEAYYNRGAVLYAKGDLERAVQDFTAAIKIKPG